MSIMIIGIFLWLLSGYSGVKIIATYAGAPPLIIGLMLMFFGPFVFLLALIIWVCDFDARSNLGSKFFADVKRK